MSILYNWYLVLMCQKSILYLIGVCRQLIVGKIKISSH